MSKKGSVEELALWCLGTVLAGATLTGCSTPLSPTPNPGGQGTALTLTSTAFAQGKPIPARYTCDGEELSPPLAWSAPPARTQSLALIVDDPDARGIWTHWVVYNLPAQARALPEGVAAEATRADGSMQGKNSGGQVGYGGPCPPSGTHRYVFRLYALDIKLSLAAGASKNQVLQAMQGHALAQGELMGTYARK